jgi:hypothetical protein
MRRRNAEAGQRYGTPSSWTSRSVVHQLDTPSHGLTNSIRGREEQAIAREQGRAANDSTINEHVNGDRFWERRSGTAYGDLQNREVPVDGCSAADSDVNLFLGTLSSRKHRLRLAFQALMTRSTGKP